MVFRSLCLCQLLWRCVDEVAVCHSVRWSGFVLAACVGEAPSNRGGSKPVQGTGSVVSALLSPHLLLRGRVDTRHDQRCSGAPAVIGPFPRGPAFVGALPPRAAGEPRLCALRDSAVVSRVSQGWAVLAVVSGAHCACALHVIGEGARGTRVLVCATRNSQVPSSLFSELAPSRRAKGEPSDAFAS